MRHNAANQARWQARQRAKFAALHLENEHLRLALRGKPAALFNTILELRAEIEDLRDHINAMHAGHWTGWHDPMIRIILGMDRPR